MARYLLVFVIAVACMFAGQAGILPNPLSWNFGWGSQVEVKGNISSKDLKAIDAAVQSYAGGESKPLVAVSKDEGSERILATYQGGQTEVEGAGGMKCGIGSTYTLVKRNGTWKVVDASFWFG